MMDDEPERMDPRCDAGGRGYMLWMEYCNDGEYIRATDYDALAAKLDDPRVKALAEALRDMTALAIQLGAIDLETRDALAALSALEENK